MIKSDYKYKEDKIHKGLHNLSGVYLKEENDIDYNGQKLFTFCIIYPKKVRVYYSDDSEEYKKWIAILKKATGFAKLTNEYEIQQKLGNGRFGLVKKGIHLKTGREVAIKIMKKSNMSESDLGLVKLEFEVMKVSQHPNIIHIYDYYENQDFIYISSKIT